VTQPYLVEQPAGYLEYQLPVSLKAALVWRRRVPLLLNERDEWELPGGKLELGEVDALPMPPQYKQVIRLAVAR
jgi:hypothetical protein